MGITRSSLSLWPSAATATRSASSSEAPGDVVLLEVAGDDVGRAAHHREAVLVGDLAVVGEAVELVVGAASPISATKISTS